jgi:reactive intermediate/imine deaminase
MQNKRPIKHPGTPPALGPYTDAVIFNDLVFLSGVGALDAAGNLVGGDDAAAQADHIFRIMSDLLAEAGATFADVLKLTIFLTDIADRARIVPVRKKYFGEATPTSTLVEVSALAVLGMKVEIEAIAVASST